MHRHKIEMPQRETIVKKEISKKNIYLCGNSINESFTYPPNVNVTIFYVWEIRFETATYPPFDSMS